jgi:hypothetical protein
MKYLCNCLSILPTGVLTPNGANVSTNIRIANQIINSTSQQFASSKVVSKQSSSKLAGKSLSSDLVEIADNTKFNTVKAVHVNGTSLVTQEVTGRIYCLHVDAQTAACKKIAVENTEAEVISTTMFYREEQTVLHGKGTLELGKGVWFITYNIEVPPCAWVHAYGMGKGKVGEVLIPGKHEGSVGTSFLYMAEDEILSFWAETPERVEGTSCTALRII